MRDAATDDVSLSWIRRTRFGGDAFEAAEIPLNEEREAYRLDILDGAVLKRRVELTSPAYLYTAAAQSADLGGSVPFNVRITQLSTTAGEGFGLEEAVDA
jgi:hypothetical protein